MASGYTGNANTALLVCAPSVSRLYVSAIMFVRMLFASR